MGMMRGDEYRDSLRQLKPEIYYLAEKIDSVADHPAFIPHVNAAALTYDMARAPEFEELLTTTSHLDGEKINFFTHIHHSTHDLVRKVKALRALGQHTASCFARCVGHDAMNAIFSVTYDIDQKNGTDYHQRFINLLREVQAKDLFLSGAMTDAKGDRRLSPSQQPDPDQYVRVVEKKKGRYHCAGSQNPYYRCGKRPRPLGHAHHSDEGRRRRFCRLLLRAGRRSRSNPCFRPADQR